MEPFAQHLTIRLHGDRVLAPSVPARRAGARCVLEAGRRAGLLVFRIADTHLHAVLTGSRAAVGGFVRALVTKWHHALAPGARFEPARLTPVRDQRHLASAVRYVLRQDERHGLDVDPLHDASNLPDLLGARVIGAPTARLIREHLPRFDPRVYLPELAPVGVDLALLGDAAAAAFALPDLVGNAPQVVDARRAAVCVAQGAAHVDDIASTLGIHPRSVRRFFAHPSRPEHIRAVTLQLQWRAAVLAK